MPKIAGIIVSLTPVAVVSPMATLVATNNPSEM